MSDILDSQSKFAAARRELVALAWQAAILNFTKMASASINTVLKKV
jgi:hypothetical protein